MRLTYAAFGLILVAGLPAEANEFSPQLTALAEGEMRALLQDPALIAAVRAQNGQTMGLSETEITAMDQDWRAQVGAGSAPLIENVTANPVADALRAAQAASGGLYTEIFLMDAVGLNVAASDVTSDYWQGDEAKWQQTFAQGADALHISEIELDESTQAFQSQVSLSVIDPETGNPIGAATFGVNVEYLQ